MFVQHAARRWRARPGNGLVDSLIHAADVRGTLSEAELYQMIVALFIGGQEDTTARPARGGLTPPRDRAQDPALCPRPPPAAGGGAGVLRGDAPSEGAVRRGGRGAVRR